MKLTRLLSYVHFACKKPKLSVYTASFTILDMSSMSAAGQNQPSSQPKLASNALITSYPNTTALSSSTSTHTTSRSTPTAAPVSPSDEQAYLDAHTPKGPGANLASGSGSISFGHRIDFERLKFRIVFILWPAIVGITMAL